MTEIYIDDIVGYWPNTEYAIRQKLRQAGGGDVTIKIHSPGGSVIEGIAIFNTIRDYAGKVEVIVIGEAASIASYIALAGDTLKVFDSSVFFIHNVWSYTAGDHNDLREQADLQERLSKLLSKEYAKKTGKSAEEIQKLMDEETYFFGEEILNFGFADELIATDEDKNKESAIIAVKEELKALNNITPPSKELVALVLNECEGKQCEMKNKKQEAEKVADEKQTTEPAIDIDALRTEAIEQERKRIVALEKVENPGIDATTFERLVAEHRDAGKTDTELIVALHSALIAEHKAEADRLKAEKEKVVEDGKALGELVGQIEAGGGDEKEDPAKLKAQKAIEIAEKMKNRRF